MTNFYFDMDGVLVQYNKSDFIGDHPRYRIRNSHYFLTLKPDERVLDVMKILSNTPSCTVNVLTSVLAQDETLKEHIIDKTKWVSNYCPFIDIDNQLFISTGKKHHQISQIHKRPLSNKDILIDDFNKNLNDWIRAGGISVKYANGTNNPYSFNGPLILQSDTVTDIINKLLNNKLKGPIQF